LKGWRVFFAGAVLGSGACGAAAALIQNGGFETGDFTGWTLSGNTNACYVTTSFPYVHLGIYGAQLGPVGAMGFLSQTVTTSPGQTYLLSFWLNSSGQMFDEFLAAWNGTNIFDQTDITTGGWTNLQFVVSATQSSTLLQFGFRNDPGYFGLDDISVAPGFALAFQSVIKNGGTLAFTWSAQSGRVYQVQYRTNLTQTNWINLGGALTATNSTASASDSISTGRQRFYRVVQLP
jgi:hypothetical protein